MLNLSGVVRQLTKQRARAKAETERLDAALKVLRGWASSGRKSTSMSAAGRMRIAAAQRARWKKWRAEK